MKNKTRKQLEMLMRNGLSLYFQRLLPEDTFTREHGDICVFTNLREKFYHIFPKNTDPNIRLMLTYKDSGLSRDWDSQEPLIRINCGGDERTYVQFEGSQLFYAFYHIAPSRISDFGKWGVESKVDLVHPEIVHTREIKGNNPEI